MLQRCASRAIEVGDTLRPWARLDPSSLASFFFGLGDLFFHLGSLRLCIVVVFFLLPLSIVVVVPYRLLDDASNPLLFGARNVREENSHE